MESSSSIPVDSVFAPKPEVMDVPDPLSLDVCPPPQSSKLVFACQLAHGSSTAYIEQVDNIGELYDAIASCFPETEAGDILFCTLNSRQVKMECLISTNVPADATIFAHVRGQKKEVRLVKTHLQLGLTLTDNSNGKSFVKRIKNASVSFYAQPAIEVGDHIVAINGASMEGRGPFEVARTLRKLPVGEEFVIRLISPKKSGFSSLAPRSSRSTSKQQTHSDIGDGRQTLRFIANGAAVIQEAPCAEIIEKLNAVFDKYLGLNDDDLALTIWETGTSCSSHAEMNGRISDSPMGVFGFPEDLVFDMWSIVQDYKRKLETEGRLAEIPKALEANIEKQSDLFRTK
ncbi:hypothetical protein L596_007431 [Steinernema carpocapsae]|uniref:PDZ domain-containing protein n=1 Tax=Steinernema carpocapsae TaxID=34508 RepID=A0A4U5P993_STECR|nr:hypothetical protein L596_007431 [Steinernema carpocapsae]